MPAAPVVCEPVLVEVHVLVAGAIGWGGLPLSGPVSRRERGALLLIIGGEGRAAQDDCGAGPGWGGRGGGKDVPLGAQRPVWGQAKNKTAGDKR